MKIYFNQANSYYKPKLQNSKQKKVFCNENYNKSIPYFYYSLPFRGANISKMYEEYNWYIYNDGVKPIYSFLKMIAPKEEMDEFLTHILKTKDRSYEFIDSIVSIPREANDIYKRLVEKVGANSKNLMTFMQDGTYYQAYKMYTEEKFNRANTLSELLRVRPDWSDEALKRKYFSLSGNNDLKIGKIPKQIPSEHLKQIIPYLMSKMEIGVKTSKKIDNLVIDGRTYEFKYFTEGKSSKNVFGVFVPIMMKKYIIKIDNLGDRNLDAPFGLGTLAKIDKYLTANRSRNSAPLCYYDYKNNFSIYKYIEHAHIDKIETQNIDKIKTHLPDFDKLGLSYNDTVGYNNFFLLNEASSDTHYKTEGFQEALKKREWISVDNDHVTYNNKFQPSISGFHKSLPNAMQMFY